MTLTEGGFCFGGKLLWLLVKRPILREIDFYPSVCLRRKFDLALSLFLEGNFLGNNLSITDGVTKQGIMKLLSRINMESKDVLLLLLQGKKVFVQPYKGDSLTVRLEESES